MTAPSVPSIESLTSLIWMMHSEGEVAVVDQQGQEWHWYSLDYDGIPHYKGRPLTPDEVHALAYAVTHAPQSDELRT